MKKIFLLLIIIIVSYSMFVFAKPTLADSIGSVIGLQSFNIKLRSFLGEVNKTTTNIPSISEIREGYDSALSGAIEVKDTVMGGIEDTKEVIDTVRSTLSGAEDTYNKAKDVINDTTDSINKIKDTLNNSAETIGKIKGTIDAVQDIGNTVNSMVNTGSTN